MTRRLGAAIAGAILVSGVLWGLPVAAQYGDEDLATRMQRIERDLRDLQQEVYRGSQGLPRSGEGPPQPSGVAASQRVNDIEASLRRLTGQVEELSYRLNELSVKVDRLQNELNYATGQGGAPEGAPADEGTQLAPGPGNLGAMRPGANAAAPAGGDRVVLTPPGKQAATGPIAATGTGGAASGKFDAAMDQLARGSYDQARSAFRAIADQHPNHQLAPEALYWAGDISYSAKKDYTEAARSFAELLKKYPKAPHAPDAMLKLGQSLIALGQKKEGCSTLAAFPAKYPSAGKALTARAKADAKKAACA
ncbi:MAG: tol-pal system protein YbgF [Alphaproteobacteria bacterium]